ncbi:MAG: hypothetical protein ACREJ2_00315 [Planctomycetota bacterium]
MAQKLPLTLIEIAVLVATVSGLAYLAYRLDAAHNPPVPAGELPTSDSGNRAPGTRPTAPPTSSVPPPPPAPTAPVAPATSATPATPTTPAENPLAPPQATPPAAVTWKVVDQRSFDGRLAWEKYHPFYVIDADPIGNEMAQDPEIKWRFYDDTPWDIYHPATEVLLNSTRVIDRSIRLAMQTPHTVRWEVGFTQGHSVALVPEGAIIKSQEDEDEFALPEEPVHTLVLERVGGVLSLQVDGAAARTIIVDPADRTPLKIVAQAEPVHLKTTKLSFGNGEGLSPPPPPKVAAHPLRWSVVYQENFAKADSIKAFVVSPDGAELAWNEKDHALNFGPGPGDAPDHAYLLLHRSLPGDLRITFRARSRMAGQPAFFGLLASLSGTLHHEDAYYIEWNYWQVQIKKHNARQAGVEVSYKVTDPNAWMQFQVEKVGGAITMFTAGSKVLTWTDPHPYATNDHDLFTFYTWKVPMEIDDLVIERNALDTIKPRADDPAVEDNFLRGERKGTDNPPPGPTDDEF